jgi:hypothetical protein
MVASPQVEPPALPRVQAALVSSAGQPAMLR